MGHLPGLASFPIGLSRAKPLHTRLPVNPGILLVISVARTTLDRDKQSLPSISPLINALFMVRGQSEPRSKEPNLDTCVICL